MTGEEELLRKRFVELSRRAYSQGRYAFTEFLSLAEQDVLLTTRFDAQSSPFTLSGGFDGAERAVAAFGSAELCGYDAEPPIVCVKITPVSKKFAEALTHRDFLGALMGLGVKRSVLGDILLQENTAYVLCLDSISGFIVSELTEVRQTTVSCDVLGSLPELAVKPPEERSLNVASERLDAMVAAVYKLSRYDAQALIERRKVFVNSRLTENTSYQPDSGDIISVRGFGRFAFDGVAKETRKGRLFISVRVY
jgi:RNA-binding protein YlmH